MAYYRNSDNGYQASGRDMLAYGNRYGGPWAEDRRALERAPYDRDRSSRGSDSGLSSYHSAREGPPSSRSRGSAVSSHGHYKNHANDDEALTSAMELVRIGADNGRDSNSGGRSHSGSHSRSIISASSSSAKHMGRVTASNANGVHRNDMTLDDRYGRSHSGSSTSDYEGKGKSRAAVLGNVGGRMRTDIRPSILRTESSYQSDYGRDSGRDMNQPFHERDTLHSRSSAVTASGHYSTGFPRSRDQSYGSYGYAAAVRGPVHDIYRASMLSAGSSYRYSNSYSYDYDDGYDGSEGASSDYSYSPDYQRASGYTESSYLNSIYEGVLENYDVASSDEDGSCSDFEDGLSDSDYCESDGYYSD